MFLERLSDDLDWAERSEHWISQEQKSRKRLKKRERRTEPLILCGHGVSLRIEHGALVIRDGFTHYPQERETYRFFRGDLELPPRIVLLDGSGTLSFEVLSWLGEQGVALARIKWNGEVAIAASGTGYAADPQKVAWQRSVRADETKRMAFAADLIRRKLEASLPTLELHVPHSAARDSAISRTKLGTDRLKSEHHADANAIYAIEGDCAAAYFRAWRGIKMKWKGLSRHPIPEDWLTYWSRSSQLSGKNPKNRLASHPLNAMLNYAYTVRQSQLQIDAVSQGYDPTLGIMHNRHQGSNAYILDLIEPERPIVDAAILEFIETKTFAAADFVITSAGVCRLSPQLAKNVALLIARCRLQAD